MFILSKKPIAKFCPHHMTSVSQRASQPSRERAQELKQTIFHIFFPTFFGGCNTVYYKTMWFLTKTELFER